MLTLMLDGKLFLAPIGPTPQVNLRRQTIEARKLISHSESIGRRNRNWNLGYVSSVLSASINSY